MRLSSKIRRVSLFTMFFLFLSSIVAAKSVVNNDVFVSSNSGGNTLKNGRVIEGKELNKVEINTTIDGKKLEPISFTQTQDNKKIIEKKIDYVSEDGSVQVKNSVKSEIGQTEFFQGNNFFERKNLQITEIEVKKSLIEQLKNSVANYFGSIRLVLNVLFNNLVR